jgi:Tol biopolymer transport system component
MPGKEFFNQDIDLWQTEAKCMLNKNGTQKWLIILLCILVFTSFLHLTLAKGINQSVEAYLFDDHSVFLMMVTSGISDAVLKMPDTEFISTMQFAPNQEKACLITGLKKYESTNLYLVEAKNWEKSLLLKIESNSVITKPFWSPDSKKFVTLVGYKEMSTGDFTHYEYYFLKLYDLVTKQLTDIVKVNESINSISWSKNSNYLAFNGKENTAYSLYIYDFSTKKLNQPTTNLSSDWVFKNLNFWSQGGEKLFLVNGASLNSFEIKETRYQQIKKFQNQIITQQWNEAKNLVAVIWKDGEETSLDLVDLEQRIQKNIDKNFQIDSPRWTKDGQLISYFVKSKEQPYSKIVLFDITKNKIIHEEEAGVIDIYPWDVDPTYSQWSNRSEKIIDVIKKEEQKQVLSLIATNGKSQIEISNDWDYIFNFGWSREDDWIYVTGSKKEKNYIEFVSITDVTKKVTKPDLKFIEWRNNGGSQVPINNSKQPSRQTILIIMLLIGLSFATLVVFYTRFIRKKRG